MMVPEDIILSLLSDEERQRLKNMERIKNFCLLDPEFFTVCLDDKATVEFVLQKLMDDGEISNLRHDLACKNPDDMIYEPLAAKVRHYKENPAGVALLLKAITAG